MPEHSEETPSLPLPPETKPSLQNSTTWVATLCIIAGSIVGLAVVPRAPRPDDVPSPPPQVLFLGKTLTVNGQAQERALEQTKKFVQRTFVLRFPQGPSENISLNRWGAQADLPRLRSILSDLKDASSPLRKFWRKSTPAQHEVSNEAPRSIPSTVAIDRKSALVHLMRMKDAFDRAPENARLNLESGAVIKDHTGQWLDLDATMAAVDQALAIGKLQATAVVTTKAPERTAKEIESLQFDSVLGRFETNYSRTRKAADRTYNLRLAAERLDGTVIMPGEVFDFNGVVGARDEANGYKVATVIANGELVDGIGGGTCQISGTLHGAAFFAGLDIIERYPHTRPSSYIKMGMDATVVYPTINFRFKNSYDFPIAVHQRVEKGVVYAEILGPRQDQVVTLIRKVDQTIPYEQIERKDPRLPRGTRILAQRGIPGFRLHRYRTIRRGSHTSRERWRDIYPPTNQVIRVGTGDASLKKRSSVGTPEYRADELLILTQRRPVGNKAGEFAENREKGKYGKAGWTKEAGMPFWEE